MTPTFDAVRARVRDYPLCGAREAGRSCPLIAVTASFIDAGRTIAHGMESRCPLHADAGTPRLCLSCRGLNRSRGAYHCHACESGDEREDAA